MPSDYGNMKHQGSIYHIHLEN